MKDTVTPTQPKEVMAQDTKISDITSAKNNHDETEHDKHPPTSHPELLPDLTPLDIAMAVLCPISKYKEKTLGDLIRIDPNALTYIAKSNEKYGDIMSNHAKLICEYAAQQASA